MTAPEYDLMRPATRVEGLSLGVAGRGQCDEAMHTAGWSKRAIEWVIRMRGLGVPAGVSREAGRPGSRRGARRANNRRTIGAADELGGLNEIRGVPVSRILWTVALLVLALSVGVCLPAGGVDAAPLDKAGHWHVQESGTAEDITGVHFADILNGWAVTGDGRILHTSDGGVTWQTQVEGTADYKDNNFSLRAVEFIDHMTGWAVGGWSGFFGGSRHAVYRTRDGGANWSVAVLDAPGTLSSLSFVDAQNGWSTDGSVLCSTDSGANWSVRLEGLEDFPSGGWTYDCVLFVDKSHGWAVGARGDYTGRRPLMSRTSDGGMTWSSVGDLPSGASALSAVDFVDESRGWAVGDDGTVLTTSNGGITWSAQRSGIASNLSAVSFVDSYRGWAVGDDGIILATKDGGATWTTEESGTREPLHSVYFLNADHGWACGAKGTIVAYGAGGSGMSFTDIESSPHRAAIEGLAEAGIVDGFTDGTFRPAGLVSRQQFAKMIVLTVGANTSENDICRFDDVEIGGPSTLYPDNYIAVAGRLQITHGSGLPGKFLPAEPLSWAQLVTMVARGAGLPDPPHSYLPPFPEFSSVHYPYARAAAYAGLLAGIAGADGTYDFWARATRGEAARLLWGLKSLEGSSDR